MNKWIKQSESDIMKECIRSSTLLIKFKDEINGITIDNGETVDISWIRDPERDCIYATEGRYKSEDIKEYMIIEG